MVTALAQAPSSAAVRGALFVALSAVAFGAMAIFGRYAYAAGVDVLGLLIVRFGIGGARLLALMRVGGAAWPGPAHARECAIAAMGRGSAMSASPFCYFTALPACAGQPGGRCCSTCTRPL